jgi:hypothetical protein
MCGQARCRWHDGAAVSLKIAGRLSASARVRPLQLRTAPGSGRLCGVRAETGAGAAMSQPDPTPCRQTPTREDDLRVLSGASAGRHERSGHTKSPWVRGTFRRAKQWRHSPQHECRHRRADAFRRPRNVSCVVPALISGSFPHGTCRGEATRRLSVLTNMPSTSARNLSGGQQPDSPCCPTCRFTVRRMHTSPVITPLNSLERVTVACSRATHPMHAPNFACP